MPLNINLQQILLHALNFVILFGAMYFLLYKPVKSFMDSRKAHYEKMDEDAKAVLAEAEKTKAGYEAQLKSADEEIARRQREANDALQHAVDERRAQAEQQAEEIIKKAHDAAARTVAARRSDLNGYFIDDQFLVLFPDAAYLCGIVVLAESVIAPVGVEVHEVGR